MTVSLDPEAQWRQVLRNVRTLLEAGGATMGDVVQLRVYVRDIRHYLTFGELRREYFAPPYPVTTAVAVAALADESWTVEIEAAAYLGG
jgi:2-iminobutanoate/2-iminopropanoate deaminase